MKLTVLIRPKPGILDPQGEAVQASLATLGFAVTGARVGRLVELEMEDSDVPPPHARRSSGCATELLANPLIESFEIAAEDRMTRAASPDRRRDVPRLERPRRRPALRSSTSARTRSPSGTRRRRSTRASPVLLLGGRSALAFSAAATYTEHSHSARTRANCRQKSRSCGAPTRSQARSPYFSSPVVWIASFWKNRSLQASDPPV